MQTPDHARRGQAATPAGPQAEQPDARLLCQCNVMEHNNIGAGAFKAFTNFLKNIKKKSSPIGFQIMSIAYFVNAFHIKSATCYKSIIHYEETPLDIVAASKNLPSVA